MSARRHTAWTPRRPQPEPARRRMHGRLLPPAARGESRLVGTIRRAEARFGLSAVLGYGTAAFTVGYFIGQVLR